MRFQRVIAGGIGAALALGSPPSLAASSSRSAPTVAVSARLLASHNAERARIGAPPLQWDDHLAASAATYGPALERHGRLIHSPRSARPGQRENLWMGTRGYFAPEQMVGTWIDERRDFKPGLFPNVSRTGNWVDVAHYTQMIWRGTTHVGCAIHSTPQWDYLICRYSPPGNVDGRPVP